MAFILKNEHDTVRRAFQITVGLREGYGSDILRTLDDILDVAGTWMKTRMESGLPVITGIILTPGTILYAWNSAATGIKTNNEEAAVVSGEINPLYCASLTDATIKELLINLAGAIGEALKQTRMYVTYRDAIYILQNETQVHPTEAT